MNLLLATLVQRGIELRRVVRYVSTEALWDLWRQAPYLTSFGGTIGIAVAIAGSKLFPTTGASADELRQQALGLGTGAVGETRVPSAWPRVDAATRRSTGVALVLVSDAISEAIAVAAGALPFAIASEVLRASSCTPQAVCEQLLGATRGSRGPRDAGNWSDDRTVVAFDLISSADARGVGHSVSSIPNRSQTIWHPRCSEAN
jgi:hypothetical protein